MARAVSRHTLALPPRFSLPRTVRSHGWYALPPFGWDAAKERLTLAFLVGERAHEVELFVEGGRLRVESDPPAEAEVLARTLTRVLGLDEDLEPFYALVADHPRLGWARARGAGRLLRGATMFEDVIKMVCTTNCAWSFTEKMVERIVGALGPEAPSGRRAFPSPRAMAKAGERFYRDEVKAGYRAPHLVRIAEDESAGKLALDALRVDPSDEGATLLRKRLLALPGVGPYAAENLLRLLGAHDHLGLDSWCRARLKELYPRVRDVDAAAARRYRRYAPYAGLAMWLDVTRNWHEAV